MYLIYMANLPHLLVFALILIYPSLTFLSLTFYLSILLYLSWFSGAPHVIQSVDSVCLHASQLLSCDWNIRQGGRDPRDAPGLTPSLSAKFYHTLCLDPTHIRYAPQYINQWQYDYLWMGHIHYLNQCPLAYSASAFQIKLRVNN